MDISALINKIVPITQFNKGKASQFFSRANKGETLLVIKNNTPVAVIMSPEEYEMLRKVSQICNKATESGHNINSEELKESISQLKSFDEKVINHV